LEGRFEGSFQVAIGPRRRGKDAGVLDLGRMGGREGGREGRREGGRE
jgi:hypothetical protein